MKVYGQLERAQIEILGTDPTGANLVAGRMWFRSDSKVFKVYDGTVVTEHVDLLTAQTLQNKILESAQLNTPSVQGATNYNEIGSTPTVPAAGEHKTYFKNDGKQYSLDSAGNEVEIGAGGGGGSKNYFEDTSAEIDNTVGSWATDDGVGGTAAGLTLSVTAIAGELLSGAGSLKLVKDAADRNTEFIKVGSETIDPSDRGRANYGSFEFRPGTGFVSSDLIFEVYDVTNAAVLYSGVPADLELLNSRVRFNWVTHLEDTTAQVEFRIKVNNTNTNGFDAFFDEFKFGPAAILSAPIITEWQSYVPTGSWTNTTHQGQWRRVGDSMEIEIYSTCTGTPTGGAYAASIPTGYDIDTDKMNEAGLSILGQGFLVDVSNSANRTSGQVQNSGTQSVRILADNGSTVSDSSPFAFVATDAVRLRATLPIVNWESGAILKSNELSLQTVKAEMHLAANQVVAVGGTTQITYDTSSYDTHGIFNPGTNSLKIPKSGYYQVDCGVNLASVTLDERITTAVLVNGAGTGITTFLRAGLTDTHGDIGKTLYLEKDDVLTVTVAPTADTNYIIRGSAPFAYLSICEVPDFTVLGAVRNFEIQETILAADYTASSPAVGVWQSPNTAFKVDLTPGVFNLNLQGMFGVPVATSVTANQISYDIAFSTETAGGTGLIKTFTGHLHDFSSANWSYDLLNLSLKNHVITENTSIYVHFRYRAFSGSPTITTLGFRADSGIGNGTDPILTAERVK